MRRLTLAALAVTTALSGCAVGPDFKRPDPRLPAGWSATAGSEAATTGVSTAQPSDEAWWAGFKDAELTSLVDRTFAANLDLKQAALRIAEARAQRNIAAADLLPQVTANADYTSTLLSETTPTGKVFTSLGTTVKIPGAPSISFPNPYSQYQLGFDATWELDLFGRVRRSVEAAKADEASPPAT
jgi:outer membrane protein TolC